MKNIKTLNIKVAVISVTYGSRWKFLSKVADSVISDPHLLTFIIVDNASSDRIKISEYASKHNKVHHIKNETNLGSAGGFAQAIEYARNLPCDYILLLDDDNVPEKDFVQYFLEDLDKIGEKNVVVLGNRNKLKNSEDIFYSKNDFSKIIPNTFFDVLSFTKIKTLLKTFLCGKSKNRPSDFRPFVEVSSFAYSGTFLPIQAVKDTPLPDEKLFTYGDDVEYGWNVRRSGYKIYVCAKPLIEDIDFTFYESHILDLFSEKTSDFKIFFRMRNAALISKRQSNQGSVMLFLNVSLWFIGVCLYSLFRKGLNKMYFKRAVLIAKALYRGLKMDFSVPFYIKLPGTI